MKFLELRAHSSDWRAEVDRMRAVSEIKKALFEPDKRRRRLWPYLDTALEFAKNFDHAVVCTTQAGYVGLVLGSAKVEDVIVLIKGLVVPFVLRSIEESPDRFY